MTGGKVDIEVITSKGALYLYGSGHLTKGHVV